MTVKTKEMQAKYEILVSALQKCTHHNKTVEEKREIALEAIQEADLRISSVEMDDKDLLVGSLALHTMLCDDLHEAELEKRVENFETVNLTVVFGDLARSALRKMMPQWAYEFGRDAFDGVPESLVKLLGQLDDVSWHNDSIPRFHFIDKGNDTHYGISVGWCYEEDAEGEFIFDVFYHNEDSNPESISDESFLDEIGLPLNCGVYGKKGTLTDKDFFLMTRFISLYALPAMTKDFLEVAKRYEDENGDML